MRPEGEDDRGHRLHPYTLLFTIGATARSLLLPLLAVVLLTRGHRFQLWLAVAIVPAVLYQVFRYLTLTYRFAETEVVVRHGMIFRQERHIPYDRIDNVGLVQGPLHRLVGVAKVRLETAGSSQPEAVLDVLSLAAVEHLRRPHPRRSDRVAHPGRDGRPCGKSLLKPLRRPRRSSSNCRPASWSSSASLHCAGLLVIPVLYGIAEQLDLFERIDVDWLLDSVESATEESLRPVLVAGLAVAAVLVFLGLSVGWTILRFHDYRLERTGDLLRSDVRTVHEGLRRRRPASHPAHHRPRVGASPAVPTRLRPGRDGRRCR